MRSTQHHGVRCSAFIALGVLAAGVITACSAGDSAGAGGAAVSGEPGASAGGSGGAAASASATSTVSAPPPPAWGPPSWSSCLPHGIVTTCAEYCASYNLSCATACTSPYTGKPVGVLTFNNSTCTSFIPGGTACDAEIYTSQSTRCCCGI